MRPDRLDADRAMVLVIDVQEKLMPSIAEGERVTRSTVKLLRAASVFRLPALATEQYPKGLGATVGPVREALAEVDAPIVEKPTFSACGFDPLRQALREIDRAQVLTAGVEAHVCVQQTVLDLLAMDYDVFLCADAVGSRSPLDWQLALDRMRQAGAFITSVESAMFELCERCDTPRFKRMLDVVKAFPPT
ncbi:MAG: hydrolase [Phycisphaerales bacterium]|nr:MAG: hydrolase [Phycisphaerales bacterium]